MVIALFIGIGLPLLVGLLMLSKPLKSQLPRASNSPYAEL